MGGELSKTTTKLKRVIIPTFAREADEAAWWDAHRSQIEAEIRQRLKRERPLTLGNLLQGTKPCQPITLRMPKEDLATARRLAAREGLGYQTYIKLLLRRALAKSASLEVPGGMEEFKVDSGRNADREKRRGKKTPILRVRRDAR